MPEWAKEFSMALKGRIIRQPWIEMILCGEKTWEMLPRPWSHRGPLALIEKGTSCVVGIVDVVACLPKLDLPDMRRYQKNHCIPKELFEKHGFNLFVPLELTNIRRLERPVRYLHKNGAQNPINIDELAEEEISQQQKPPFISIKEPISVAAMVEKGNSEEVKRVSQIGPAHPISKKTLRIPDKALSNHMRHASPTSTAADISTDAEITVPQRGNKLFIKDAREKNLPFQGRSGTSFRDLVGILAECTATICLTGFVLHFTLGVFSTSISILSAFRWLIPMLIATFIATALGKSHFLEGDL